MTQQDLVQLVGLRSTDPQILAHFEQYGMGIPPKNVNPNNKVKIIYDKERNLYYAFTYEIFNDQFYPPIAIGGKHADYKFAAFLSEIGFLYKEPSGKKPDPKESAFWNVTPPPNATPAEAASWFSVPVEELENSFLENQVDKNLIIKASYDSKKKILTGTRICIIENSELISFYYLDKKSESQGHLAHLYAMLIKWLFDNKYLLLHNDMYSITMTADTDVVLAFVQRHLKGHLWDNQITTEPHLRSFLYTTIHNLGDMKNEQGDAVDFYFRNIILRQADKLETWKKLHSGQENEEKELFRSIPFNEQIYTAFYQEMNKQFEYFKKLNDHEEN